MLNMKKLIAKIGLGIGKGLIKPLPGSSIVTAIKEAKEKKWELETVIKLATYLIMIIALWGVLLGKLTVADFIAILTKFGF